MSGSMAPSPDRLSQMLQQSRAQPAPEEKPTDAPDSPPDAVSKLLPLEVRSNIYGLVPFAEFKRHYAAVWEQITQKDHLLTSRVTMEARLMQHTVRFRSWTRREQTALAKFEPDYSGQRPLEEARAAAYEYGVWRLVLQIVSFGAKRFPDLKLTPETIKEWESDPAVLQAREYLQDLDPVIISRLVAHMNDLDDARYFALLENTRNP